MTSPLRKARAEVAVNISVESFVSKMINQIDINRFASEVLSWQVHYNDHKIDYETTEQALNFQLNIDPEYRTEIDSDGDNDWQRMIDTDTIWQVRWYPRTPGGHHVVHASTFVRAITKAIEKHKEND